VYESSSEGDNGSLAESVARLLGRGRTGLVMDIDGTISPTVARPEEACVLPDARRALQTLQGELTLVAIVSGRMAADARTMVGIDGLTYVGNHGYEVWREDGPVVVPAALEWVPQLAALLETARAQIQQPGIFIENKGATASLHYRLAADPERARQELLHILQNLAAPSGLCLEEGRMVINLLPPLSISKGSAVSWLVAEYRLDGVVYVGDDETDAHAFRALQLLRKNGEVRALCIAVVGPETPTSVRQLADASLPSVEAVADLLGQVADLLKSE
jgi:trehalose 6-phosphate phosphatase